MKIIKNTIVALILVAISSGVAIADGKRIAGGSYFGCTDREYRDKLVSAAVQKDMEAFKKGLMAGMLRGICVMFKEGEEVFITVQLSSQVLFRFVGAVMYRNIGQTLKQ